LVFGIEVLQMWQAGRSSSITDPALALLIGTLMLLAANEPSARPASSLKRR
jgi:hypothetical protein